MIIPKALAQNSGFDAQESIVKLQEASVATGQAVGLDLTSGEPINAADEGILDNYIVKRSLFNSWFVVCVCVCVMFFSLSICLLIFFFFFFISAVIASNLLLVDEVMRAGMTSTKGN